MKLRLTPTPAKLLNAQGDNVKVLGEASIKMQVNETTIVDTVMVIEEDNVMLLGLSHLIYAKLIKKNWLKVRPYAKQTLEETEECKCPKRADTP